jgi:hypothetical protein
MFGLIISKDGGGCTTYGATLSRGEVTASEVTDSKSTCTSNSTSTSIIPVTITISNSGAITTTSLPQSSISLAVVTAIATTTVASGNGSGNEPSGHLGGGPIAGIAIGAIAGVVLLLMVAWWIARRTRRRRNKETGMPQDPQPVVTELGSKAIVMKITNSQIHELGGSQQVDVFELGESLPR